MALRVMGLECENGKLQKRANLIMYQEGIPLNNSQSYGIVCQFYTLINMVYVVARFMTYTS